MAACRVAMKNLKLSWFSVNWNREGKA